MVAVFLINSIITLQTFYSEWDQKVVDLRYFLHINAEPVFIVRCRAEENANFLGSLLKFPIGRKLKTIASL